MIRNAIYNVLYTGINLLFPLITMPYVSRVLGASNLGQVDFTKSIVNWFLLLASFGVTTYGVREIARNREDRDKRSQVFIELMTINGFLSLAMTVVYILLVLNLPSTSVNSTLLLIFALNIILNMFNIDWFYQGLEEYSFITIRNAIIKLLSLLSIFLLIREQDHYILYGLIIVLGTTLNSVLNFIHSRKFVTFKLREFAPFRHLKKLSIFFTISIVISIYINLDRTLLGFIVGPTAVAFMTRGKTIIDAATLFSTSISNVAMPRASHYIKTDIAKFNNLLSIVPNFILWITIPITFGVFILSYDIMYILGGEEFIQATNLLKVLSMTIILSPLSTYMNYQVLVPTGNEGYALRTSIFASITSLILNLLLIPSIGVIGAGISLVLAEIVVFVTRYITIRRTLGYNRLNFINRSTISYLIVSIFMGIIILSIRTFINDLYVSFIVVSIVGAIVYFLTLILIKEQVTTLVISKVANKIPFVKI